MILKDITLLAISGSENIKDFIDHYIALKYSLQFLEFEKVRFLSPIKPIIIDDNIEYIKIPKLNYRDYSDFMLKKLVHYVDTNFVLTIQSDGFIINPNLWSNEFYKYDYIGAPWQNIPKIYKNVRVGNGGFSLRSKRLLELCNKLINSNLNEDIVICVKYNSLLRKLGIKYAPLDIASKFSFEMNLLDYPNSTETSFGFHSKTLLNTIENDPKYLEIKNSIKFDDL